MSAGQTCMKVRCERCFRRSWREFNEDRDGFGRCMCGGRYVRYFRLTDRRTDAQAKTELRKSGQV